jgi:Protein of unknown function (DUF3486)
MPPVPKIALLPEEIRRWLHETLVERAFGDIVGVTEELQEMLRQAGVAMYIGKSAVGAESLKLKRAAESIRATTEAARLIADSSRDDADARGEAAMALVQSEVFELLLQVREAETVEDPVKRLSLMSESALALSRLSRARVSQARWRVEVETRVSAAADAVAKIARTGGLQPEQVAEIRAQILGIPR